MQEKQPAVTNILNLLLGDEAVARGAWEAGVRVITSYPGTPSTEISEAAAKFPDIHTQWATNEKVAMEVAFGAAMSGARAMTCMKHVGMNVAADPLFTAAYTGINGGLVVVVADDPSMHSSQNEQDSRYYARATHIPMLEPADSQECKDYTKLAFRLSEELDTPVMIRLTTRIAHARSLVKEEAREEIALKPYQKDPAKYVMMPAMARKRHLAVEKREETLEEAVNTLPVNTAELRDTSLGVITSGICYQYVRDALPDASVLKLGMVYPLPMALIRDFAGRVDRLIVIEELEGLIEKDVKAVGIACEGKSLTGIQGELSVERIRCAVLAAPQVCELSVELPLRPPTLCPGCPHRGIFHVIGNLKLHVMGDIGCYTLAALPPLSAMDACLCMGASIGMASGAERARGKEFSKSTVAVLGDSTFIHSGITGLIDAVYGKEAITVLILDNRITGMTGHQHNPCSGFDIHGNPAPALDLETLCRSCGVENVVVVDPLNLEEVKRVLKEETERNAVSVVIARKPCALIDKTVRKPYHTDGCRNCGTCLKVSCQAIERKGDHVEINEAICTGCGMCSQVCPFHAIVKGDDAQ
jgi:indolepyruvate ferredoxin oxidoreductase, alpha subunit